MDYDILRKIKLGEFLECTKGGDRTHDPTLMKRVLLPLSYLGIIMLRGRESRPV